jgi:hypothetical protein
MSYQQDHPRILLNEQDPCASHINLNDLFYNSCVVIADCIREKFGVCQGF